MSKWYMTKDHEQFGQCYNCLKNRRVAVYNDMHTRVEEDDEVISVEYFVCEACAKIIIKEKERLYIKHMSRLNNSYGKM